MRRPLRRRTRRSRPRAARSPEDEKRRPCDHDDHERNRDWVAQREGHLKSRLYDRIDGRRRGGERLLLRICRGMEACQDGVPATLALKCGGEVVGREVAVTLADPPNLIDALGQTLSQSGASGARFRRQMRSRLGGRWRKGHSRIEAHGASEGPRQASSRARPLGFGVCPSRAVSVSIWGWYIICVPSFKTGEPPKSASTGRRFRHSAGSLGVVSDKLYRRFRHSRPSFKTGSGVSLGVVSDRRRLACGRLRGCRLSRACPPPA
jgi:hypothetical protein